MEDQAIIEKFEFFPIKCRVQRSLEVYKLLEARRREAPPEQEFSVQVVPRGRAAAVIHIHEGPPPQHALAESLRLRRGVDAPLGRFRLSVSWKEASSSLSNSLLRQPRL